VLPFGHVATRALVLKGQKLADLLGLFARSIACVARTAKVLGLTAPPALLTRADEVIE
jgi:hypothetical protein